MTPTELNQQIVDLIKASGFKGAAVLVLIWKGHEGEALSCIGSNVAKKTEVANMLELAAALARGEAVDVRISETTIPHKPS